MQNLRRGNRMSKQNDQRVERDLVRLKVGREGRDTIGLLPLAPRWEWWGVTDASSARRSSAQCNSDPAAETTTMTSGELCVAAPARPVTCTEKIYPVCGRRKAQPRCLFGAPDPVETELLFQEQMRLEVERFQRRWDVDLERLEAAVQERLQTAPPQHIAAPTPVSPLRLSVERPKRLRPTGLHKQTHLTDFWRTRRSLAFVHGKNKSKARSYLLQTRDLE